MQPSYNTATVTRVERRYRAGATAERVAGPRRFAYGSSACVARVCQWPPPQEARRPCRNLWREAVVWATAGHVAAHTCPPPVVAGPTRGSSKNARSVMPLHAEHQSSLYTQTTCVTSKKSQKRSNLTKLPRGGQGLGACVAPSLRRFVAFASPTSCLRACVPACLPLTFCPLPRCPTGPGPGAAFARPTRTDRCTADAGIPVHARRETHRGDRAHHVSCAGLRTPWPRGLCPG